MTATSVNDVSVHANDFDESVAYYKQLFGIERIPSPKAVYRRSHEQQLHDTTAFFSKMYKLADGSVQTYLRDIADNLVEVDRPDASTLDPRVRARTIRRVRTSNRRRRSPPYRLARGRRRPKGAAGMHSLKRHVAAVTAVLGALAIAAPIADAGAATTPGTYPGFSLYGVPLAFVDPSVGGMAFAEGPTVINDVFNGATVVQSVNGEAYSSVIGSP